MHWFYGAMTLIFSAVFIYEYFRAMKNGENLVLKLLQGMTQAARAIGEEIVGKKRERAACAIGVGFFTLGLCAILLGAIGNILVPYDIDEWPWRLGFVVCAASLLLIGVPAGKRFNDWLLQER